MSRSIRFKHPSPANLPLSGTSVPALPGRRSSRTLPNSSATAFPYPTPGILQFLAIGHPYPVISGRLFAPRRTWRGWWR